MKVVALLAVNFVSGTDQELDLLRSEVEEELAENIACQKTVRWNYVIGETNLHRLAFLLRRKTTNNSPQ